MRAADTDTDPGHHPTGPVASPMRSRSRGGVRPQKTAMRLAQRIVDEITDRDLVDGDTLPGERAMLGEYQVARGTLREALRLLEIQGVIRMKTGPGGGPVVSDPGARHLASVIAMRLQLSRTPFVAVLEARALMEPAMARRAAERIAPAELEGLRLSALRMAERVDDVEAFLAENERFHTLLARGAGNELFSLVIASLNWICDATPLGVEYPRASREKVLGDHEAMYEAIAAGDADLAEELMARHIADFADYLHRRYPAVTDARLRWDQVDG